MVEGSKKIQTIKKRERMKGEEGKKQETEKEKQD